MQRRPQCACIKLAHAEVVGADGPEAVAAGRMSASNRPCALATRSTRCCSATSPDFVTANPPRYLVPT